MNHFQLQYDGSLPNCLSDECARGYPAASKVSELEARPGLAPQAIVYHRPVQDPPKVPKLGDPVPIILSVPMDPTSVCQGQEVVFVATTNLLAEELQAVYLSSIVGPDCWWGQELHHDPRTNQWSLTKRLGERVRIILDSPSGYVLAVTKKGQVTEARKIPMRWLFSKWKVKALGRSPPLHSRVRLKHY